MIEAFFVSPGAILALPYLVIFTVRTITESEVLRYHNLEWVLFVLLAARTRYKAPFYLYLAAIMCGLSVLAKGLAGLGLPVIVFVVYLAITGNWRRLQRAQLGRGSAAAVLLLLSLVAVLLPYYLYAHWRARRERAAHG